MQHDHMQHDQSGSGPADSESTHRQWTVSRWVFIGFALIAGYFLITEHRAHLVGFVPYLPFLLVAACPLLHFFHHSGHGHGDQDSPASRLPRSGGPGDPAGGSHSH